MSALSLYAGFVSPAKSPSSIFSVFPLKLEPIKVPQLNLSGRLAVKYGSPFQGLIPSPIFIFGTLLDELNSRPISPFLKTSFSSTAAQPAVVLCRSTILTFISFPIGFNLSFIKEKRERIQFFPFYIYFK